MTQVNQATIDLIKQWEGCKLKAYKDVAGIWTVGYGLTSRAGFIEVGPDTALTQDDADYYLEKVVDDFASKIRPMITAPINENQFGAFVSLAYNIGVVAFKRSSALKRFNAGEGDRVTEAIRMWKKAGGKTVQGLVNRREAEVALFLTPVETVIRPKARSTPTQSRTVQTSVVQGATAVSGAVGALSALDGTVQTVAVIGCILIALMSLFILRERLKAWASGWR